MSVEYQFCFFCNLNVSTELNINITVSHITIKENVINLTSIS